MHSGGQSNPLILPLLIRKTPDYQQTGYCSNPRCASRRLSRHHLTEWMVGSTHIFRPFRVDLGINDDVCDRIRGFDPYQVELFVGMMEVI